MMKRTEKIAWNIPGRRMWAVLIPALLIGCGGGSETGKTANNTAPIANAGQDENVTTGSVVTLNGGACTDADGDLLTYSWSFMSRPAESASVLSSASSVRPTFTADKDGDYVIRLVVNDGHEDSGPDTVTITALNPVGGWGTPTLIETGSGRAENLSVAMDDNGNAIAVWQQYDGGTGGIYANRYVPETGWGLATLIETGSGYVENLSVAKDGNGNVIMVWKASGTTPGISPGVYAKRFSPVTGWEPATVIENYHGETGVGSVSSPGLVMDGSGKAIVTWTEYRLPLVDGTVNGIWSKCYDPETGWGPATQIDGESRWPLAPSVAMDGKGNALVVWARSDGTNSHIYSARYSTETGWENIGPIENGPGDATAPRIAIDEAGNGIAVWSQKNGGRSGIYASRYLAGSGWDTPTSIESGSRDTLAPTISTDASGNAVVMWLQEVGGPEDHSIWMNYFELATGWGTATLVIDPVEDVGWTWPEVAMDTSGNVICVWSQGEWESGGEMYPFEVFVPRDIYAISYVPGTGWSTATLLDTRSEDAEWKVFVMPLYGNGLVVWQQWDGSTNNLWATEYRKP